MIVLPYRGGAFQGAEALRHLAEKSRWGWPIRALAATTLGKRLLEHGYKSVARNRRC